MPLRFLSELLHHVDTVYRAGLLFRLVHVPNCLRKMVTGYGLVRLCTAKSFYCIPLTTAHSILPRWPTLLLFSLPHSHQLLLFFTSHSLSLSSSAMLILMKSWTIPNWMIWGLLNCTDNLLTWFDHSIQNGNRKRKREWRGERKGRRSICQTWLVEIVRGPSKCYGGPRSMAEASRAPFSSMRE